jgi:hypothetical protein
VPAYFCAEDAVQNKTSRGGLVATAETGNKKLKTSIGTLGTHRAPEDVQGVVDSTCPLACQTFEGQSVLEQDDAGPKTRLHAYWVGVVTHFKAAVQPLILQATRGPLYNNPTGIWAIVKPVRSHVCGCRHVLQLQIDLQRTPGVPR